jgi:hypothetical protein
MAGNADEGNHTPITKFRYSGRIRRKAFTLRRIDDTKNCAEQNIPRETA